MKPAAAACVSSPKSQVVEVTSPTAADWVDPKRPTMAASIYCMMMMASCAIMAGQLSCSVRAIC